MDKELDDTLDLDTQSEIESTPSLYQNPTLPADEALKLLESCPVCNCRVRFTNFSDFARLISHEVIRCEECGYRAKKDMNHLQ